MEKLVIAAVCFKSKVDTNMTINAPMARMEMYGVLNLEDILATGFGSWPFLAIAKETLDKPIRLVRKTLTVAIKAPNVTAVTMARFPVVSAASAIGELDCASIL